MFKIASARPLCERRRALIEILAGYDIADGVLCKFVIDQIDRRSIVRKRHVTPRPDPALLVRIGRNDIVDYSDARALGGDAVIHRADDQIVTNDDIVVRQVARFIVHEDPLHGPPSTPMHDVAYDRDVVRYRSLPAGPELDRIGVIRQNSTKVREVVKGDQNI